MPRTSVTDQLLKNLKDQLSLEKVPSSRFAIGYSGGRDSTVLLWLLCKLVATSRLTAIHVDHRWRSIQERDQERFFVRQQCANWGVTLVEMIVEVEPRSEAQARTQRYALWDEWIKANQPISFFLAHHRDDQAETVLMRLLKGRSWGGLSGIPSQRGRYRRPLLEVPRSMLVQVAEEQGLSFFEDSTNSEDFALRNFLRTTIFPQLKQRFPRADQALASFAGYWREHIQPEELDPHWDTVHNRFSIDSALWDSWSSWRKVDQLEALASRASGQYPTRRFLETICSDRASKRAQGCGWVLSKEGSRLQWARFQMAPKSAGVCALIFPSTWAPLGRWMVFWGPNRPETGESCEVPGIVQGYPLILRTRIEGWIPPNLTSESVRMKVRQSDLWLFQNGRLMATINLSLSGVVWTQMTSPKLHKGKFFVTLVKRSDYERR